MATADPGDGSLLANGCHDGAEILGAIHEQGWREGGLCCAAGDAAPSQGYTVAECTAAGGVPTTDPGDGSLNANGCLISQGCPDGETTLGTIREEGWIEGGLCCSDAP